MRIHIDINGCDIHTNIADYRNYVFSYFQFIEDDEDVYVLCKEKIYLDDGEFAEMKMWYGILAADDKSIIADYMVLPHTFVEGYKRRKTSASKKIPIAVQSRIVAYKEGDDFVYFHTSPLEFHHISIIADSSFEYIHLDDTLVLPKLFLRAYFLTGI